MFLPSFFISDNIQLWVFFNPSFKFMLSYGVGKYHRRLSDYLLPRHRQFPRGYCFHKPGQLPCDRTWFRFPAFGHYLSRINTYTSLFSVSNSLSVTFFPKINRQTRDREAWAFDPGLVYFPDSFASTYWKPPSSRAFSRILIQAF